MGSFGPCVEIPGSGVNTNEDSPNAQHARELKALEQHPDCRTGAESNSGLFGPEGSILIFCRGHRAERAAAS